jgi:hypothetical protein
MSPAQCHQLRAPGRDGHSCPSPSHSPEVLGVLPPVTPACQVLTGSGQQPGPAPVSQLEVKILSQSLACCVTLGKSLNPLELYLFTYK